MEKRIMKNRLYRNTENALIGGVCSGLAEYFDIDPTIVRIIWAASILSGVGLGIYLIMWVIVPLKDDV
jgi:phage shock protein PspC (stress-responsive transcriptional regulator)